MEQIREQQMKRTIRKEKIKRRKSKEWNVENRKKRGRWEGGEKGRDEEVAKGKKGGVEGEENVQKSKREETLKRQTDGNKREGGGRQKEKKVRQRGLWGLMAEPSVHPRLTGRSITSLLFQHWIQRQWGPLSPPAPSSPDQSTFICCCHHCAHLHNPFVSAK